MNTLVRRAHDDPELTRWEMAANGNNASGTRARRHYGGGDRGRCVLSCVPMFADFDDGVVRCILLDNKRMMTLASDGSLVALHCAAAAGATGLREEEPDGSLVWSISRYTLAGWIGMRFPAAVHDSC